MLTVRLFDDSSRQVAEIVPLSVNIKLDLYVPAHSAVVVIPYRKISSCAALEIFDGGQTVFRGIVDDEAAILNSSGKFLRYSSRSLMALLLDSEARPCEYIRPTGVLLAKSFLEPLGIEHNAEDRPMHSNIPVEKGMSEYAVLRKYCMEVYSRLPFITADGRFDFEGGFSDSTVQFGRQGIPYTELSVTHKRFSYISEIRMKLNKSSYSSVMENPAAENMDIRRIRYLDASPGSSTPQKVGAVMLDNSNKGAMSAKLICVGRVTDCLGTAAKLDDEFAEEVYTVCRLDYVYNSQKETTAVYLERRI